MRKSSFVEKTVKHIKDKKIKKDIEFELTDHFIEKEKWYENIGYDEESACENADNAMGDPDVVGEQLASFKKCSVVKSVIAFLVALLPSFFFLFTTGVIGYEVWDLRWYFSFLFNLVLMFYAAKRQNIFLLIWGAFVSLFQIWNNSLIVYTIKYKLCGDNISKVFFFGETDGYCFWLPENESNIDNIYDALESSYSGFSLLIYIFIISLIIIFCVANIIRIILIKRRMNSLKGYYAGNMLKYIFSVFTVFIGIIIGLQVYDIISFDIHYTDYNAETISKMDEIIVEGIINYEKTGDEKYLSCWDEANKLSDDYCKISDCSMEIQSYHYLKNVYFARKPFSRKTGEQVIEFTKNTNSLLENAPKPYIVEYDKENKTVTLDYNCEYYGLLQLEFKYSDGEFRMTGNNIITDVNVKLTDEQMNLFYDAFINNNSGKSNDPSYHLDEYIPDCEKYIFLNFYGIDYNSSKELYTAYFNTFPYYTAKYSGEYYSYDDTDYIIA